MRSWCRGEWVEIPWPAVGGGIVWQRRFAGTGEWRGPKYLFDGRPGRLYIDSGSNPCWREVAICEGALDALALRVLLRDRPCIVAAIPSATIWRAEWATIARGRTVRVATDADDPGDAVGREIAAACRAAGAARVTRWRPRAKDWGDELAARVVVR